MSSKDYSTLSDMVPYIEGTLHTGKAKLVYRCNQLDFEDFLTMLEENPISKEVFELCEVSKDFYTSCVDFARLIPKMKQDELFYAAKNQEYYREFPSFAVYLLKKAWKEANGIPNLIPKLLPLPALRTFFMEGYFLGGLSLQEAILNICTEEYKPLSSSAPKNKLADFTEIYVQATDMVAAVPHSIGDNLTTQDILRISLTPNGLGIDGKVLRAMAGYAGAVNSNYDLRAVI